ncbi:4185_t:CDS:1 [Dentiscutata erythropus]|uniref:4185_t:CDS:1 n=1 Tax=Dentiscutata erythropus TaxID=1348616 RepID=A0A9N8VDY1_9GLOM|nr:4185_t:CDS:1 [Dentiscutata erythropus]
MNVNSIWRLFLIIQIVCFTAINTKAEDKKSENAIVITEFKQFNNYQGQNFTETPICNNGHYLQINNNTISAGFLETIVASTLFAKPTASEITKPTPTAALDCCDTGGPGIINQLPGAFYSMSYNAVSLEDCCRKCSADSNCIGWGYNIKTKSCFAESVNDPDAEEFCTYSADHYANFVGGRPGCGGCRAKLL